MGTWRPALESERRLATGSAALDGIADYAASPDWPLLGGAKAPAEQTIRHQGLQKAVPKAVPRKQDHQAEGGAQVGAQEIAGPRGAEAAIPTPLGRAVGGRGRRPGATGGRREYLLAQ